MKKIVKLVSLALTLAVAFGLLYRPVNANAAGPATWYVVFDVNSNKYFASTDKANWMSLWDMDKYFGAGDNIVVDAAWAATPTDVEITVHAAAGEIAFIGGTKGIVYGTTCKNTYAMDGSTGILHMTKVDNVTGIAGGTIQVFGDVGKLTSDYSKEAEGKYFIYGVTGTVDEALIKYHNSYLYPGTVYNIKAGKCYCSATNGIANFYFGDYDTEPGAAPAAPATAPAADGGKTLDKVPKTGANEISTSAIFFMLAAILALGAVAYKKKYQ